MKSIKIIFLLAITSLIAISCNESKSVKNNGYTSITGTVKMPYKKGLTLSKIVQGKPVPVATATLNDKNQFGFMVNPDKEGFYTISDHFINIPLYIKGNQNFKIEYTEAGGYALQKAPDAENEVLYNWTKKIDTLKIFDFRIDRTKTFRDFFPFYTKFIPQMQAYHKKVATKNKHFNKLMNAYIDLRTEEIALRFLYTPRSKHPKKNQMAPFYNDFMDGNLFNTSIALQLPGGLNTLKMHQSYKEITSADKRPKNMNAAIVQSVKNDTLKSFLALEYLKNYKVYNQKYIDFIKPVRKALAASPYVKEQVIEHESKIRSIDPGVQGYNFSYEDINGNQVSFNSLRGKLVYIDLWATWCAPCKAQIPYLKDLEEDFKDSPIQFVSISLDKPKNKALWKKFVKKEQLSGIQLISDNAFKTSVARDYKVTEIPRFLLFDKEGKIIDANAKRPSNPKLKKQLTQLLK